MPPNDNNAPNNINLYLYAILYVVKKLIPWDSSKKIFVISLFKIVDMMQNNTIVENINNNVSNIIKI